MRAAAFVISTVIVAVCVANSQAAMLAGNEHSDIDALKGYQTEWLGDWQMIGHDNDKHFRISLPARSWALGHLGR